MTQEEEQNLPGACRMNSSLVSPLTQTARSAFPDKPPLTVGVRKSCEFCRSRKKKCDGDSIHPCSLCTANRIDCKYERRKLYGPKRRRTVSGASHAGTPAAVASVGLTGDTQGKSTTHTGALAGKMTDPRRCGFGPSSATGLVGMQEGRFLSSYFRCMGFIPLTCQSAAREVMVRIMSAPPRRRTSGATTQLSAAPGTLVPSDGSLVLFWCAIALGGLVEGCPPETVARYVELATKALRAYADLKTPTMVRAYTMMGFLMGFLGWQGGASACDGVTYLKNASVLLEDLFAEGMSGEYLPKDFVELVHHSLDAMTYHAKLPESPEMDALLYRRLVPPKVEGFMTATDLFRISTYTDRYIGSELKRFLPEADLDDRGAMFAQGGEGLTAEQHSPCRSIEDAVMEADIPVGFIRDLIEEVGGQYGQVQDALRSPELEESVGGLLLNSHLATCKAVKRDEAGALECAKRGVRAITRYPGLCKSPIGIHAMHCLAAVMASLGSEEVYDEAREIFNQWKPEMVTPLPPMSEWASVGNGPCDMIFCRSIERALRNEDPGVVVPNGMSDTDGRSEDSLEAGVGDSMEIMREADNPDVQVASFDSLQNLLDELTVGSSLPDTRMSLASLMEEPIDSVLLALDDLGPDDFGLDLERDVSTMSSTWPNFDLGEEAATKDAIPPSSLELAESWLCSVVETLNQHHTEAIVDPEDWLEVKAILSAPEVAEEGGVGDG